MKRMAVLLLSITIVLCLAGCCLKHTWVEATCTAPKTCSECGKTEGEALPHTWIKATCKNAKTCSVCGTTEGEPLEHTWAAADCTHKQTCTVCNTTQGEPLGHDWMDATCTMPKTCSVCDQTEGEPIEHSWEWTVTSEPGYGKRGLRTGVCTVCGESVEEQIDELVPEYSWNESITLEMPLETVDVGIYKDDNEYWIEFRCHNMNTDDFLAFFTNSTSNWGFTTRDVAERLLTLTQRYDRIWQEGTMAYVSMEGYGIKWTAYMQMNKNVPTTVGIKVNNLREFTALFDGIINE